MMIIVLNVEVDRLLKMYYLQDDDNRDSEVDGVSILDLYLFLI